MAQKTFPQFPDGTPSASRIFLHADPTTGEIEKAEISDISGGGALVHLANVASANNSGTNPQTMATIPVPANTLAANGDSITIFMNTEYLTATGTKTMRIDFAAQNLIQRSVTTAGVQQWFVKLVRIDATHLRTIGYLQTGLTLSLLAGSTLFVFDPTISNNISVVISAGAANDIAYYFTTVDIATI